MPSKKITVEWSESASLDLKSIIMHIAASSPKNAKDVLARIKKECQVLEKFPDVGRIPVELEYLQINGFRELVVSPWRIFYRKEENRVKVLAVVDSVLAVVDSRRDLDDALWTRMMFPII